MKPVVERKRIVLAEVGLFYAAAIWGSTFFMVKSALSGIDPVIMVGYRFLMAGGVLLVFLLAKKRNVLHELKKSLFLSVILFLLYIPQTLGLQYTTASNSGFITGLFVMFIPLFLKTIFKRNPTRMEVIASVVSLLGLWILTGGMHDINTGDILTLLAAVTYALHVLYSDKYMKAGIDPLVISCQQFLLVGLMSLFTGLVVGLPFEITTFQAGWTVVFLALLPTLSAFVIQMYAQRMISPLRVSLIFALEPVFAALFAWTLGGEEFITRRALGGLLIFLALIISGLPTPKRWRARRARA
ncbi:MAG TPA: DMT family transporter [candidate division Zixibacteria bacterium]|nr:DMT family transporter [candidate division Zixibacteria bacterium]